MKTKCFKWLEILTVYVQLGQDITYTALNMFNFICHKYLHKIEKYNLNIEKYKMVKTSFNLQSQTEGI